MKTGDIILIGVSLLFFIGVLNLIFAFRSYPNRKLRKAVRDSELVAAFDRGYNQGYRDGQEDRKTYLGRARVG